MTSHGLLVRLHAKPQKDAAVEEFLRSAQTIVEEEPGTIAWFAVRFSRGEYGIFDVFPDDAARDAHLAGPLAAALQQRAGELFDAAPRIQKVEVLADKIPIVATMPDTKGLLLTFKAKSGREQEVEEFLRDAKRLVSSEPNTTAWFAMRTENGEYGIFDVFPDNEDRFLHLVGHLPRELAKNALKLFGSMPEVEMLSVHAEKISGEGRQLVSH